MWGQYETVGSGKHGTDVIDSVRGKFGAVAFLRLAWASVAEDRTDLMMDE